MTYDLFCRKCIYPFHFEGFTLHVERISIELPILYLSLDMQGYFWLIDMVDLSREFLRIGFKQQYSPYLIKRPMLSRRGHP